MVRTLLVSALGRDSFSECQLHRLDALGSVDIVAVRRPLSDGEFIAMAKDHEVVALTRRPKKYLHQPVLSCLPDLKSLVVHTTGTHWIDVDYLRSRGNSVVGLGGYATESVAEHAVATLLMLSRRTHLSVDRSRDIVPPSVSLRGFQLRGRTLGLIGYGRIGRRVHELLGPFEMDVSIHDPAFEQSVSLDELLARSELVVLAASQDYGRAPLLDHAALGHDSVRYVVNASCDELVDHGAVVAAIQAGRLDGFAVDEFDSVLANADVEPGRVVQTMHTGWYSDEALAAGKEEWLDNIEVETRRLRGRGAAETEDGAKAAA